MAEWEGTHLQYYVVTVIDLLGQQQKLSGWNQLPDGDAIPDDMLRAIKKTAGAALALREIFDRYFASVAKTTMPERVARLSEYERARYERFRECSLTTQRFSDTFLFCSPLANKHRDLSTLQVHRMVGAACIAMLTSLSAEVPLRGGIAIGTGLTLKDGGFYGPAMAIAHHLESRVAQSPRIVVSREVLQYLREMRSNPERTQLGSMMANIAQGCSAFLVQDGDGLWIVDFMGAAVREQLALPEILNAVHKAYEFVRREHRRFLKEGDTKLEPRYHKLLRYIESRIYLWTS